MSFWQRWRDPLDLNARLDARRSKPRPEFVQRMTDELTGSRRAARPPLRLALAAALTLMLVAAGSIGGGATAATFKRPVAKVVKSVHKVLGAKKATPRHRKGLRLAHAESDNDQYAEERRQCRLAAVQAHAAYHVQRAESHQQFHEAPFTPESHFAFHKERNAAHDEYHETVFKPAMEACAQIGRA